MANGFSPRAAQSFSPQILENVDRQIAESEAILMVTIHEDDIRVLVDRLARLYQARERLMDVTNSRGILTG